MIKKILVTSFYFFNILSSQNTLPVGILQAGNTCYMSSAIQSLYNIEPLREFILSKKNRKYYAEGSVSESFINLVELIKTNEDLSGPGLINISDFCKKTLSKLGIPEKTQWDSGDFIEKLIDKLSDDDINLKTYNGDWFGYPKERPKNEITDLFAIVEQVVSECKHKKDEQSSWLSGTEIKFIRSVALLKSGLHECLNKYFDPDFIDGAKCRHCDKLGIKQTRKLLFEPSFLIIQLLRFQKSSLTIEKIDKPIKIQLEINIRDYLVKETKKDVFYDLVSIIQHSGSFGGGHYTALIKRNNNWYWCDDSMISSITNINDLEDKGFINKDFTPYILFYKKRNSITDNSERSELSALLSKKEDLSQENLSNDETREFLDLTKEFVRSRKYRSLDSLIRAVNQGFVTIENLIKDIENFKQEKELNFKPTEIKLQTSDLQSSFGSQIINLLFNKNKLVLCKLFNIQLTSSILSKLDKHTKYVTSAAISKNAVKALTGSEDKTAILWDISDKSNPLVLCYLKGHTDSITSVYINSDATMAITGSKDNNAIVWDISDKSSPSIYEVLKGHKDYVSSVASNDSSTVITGSWDNTAILWFVSNKSYSSNLKLDSFIYSTLKFHSDAISSVALNSNASVALIGSLDETASLWDISNKSEPRHASTLKGHKHSISSVALDKSGSIALTGSWDGTVRLWDISSLDNPKLFSILEGHKDYISSVALSGDASRALIGSWDKTATLWNISNRYTPLKISTFSNTKSVRSVSFDEDISTALIGSIDHGVLWSIGISIENNSIFKKLDLSQVRLIIKLVNLKEYNNELSPDSNCYETWQSLDDRIKIKILKKIEKLPKNNIAKKADRKTTNKEVKQFLELGSNDSIDSIIHRFKNAYSKNRFHNICTKNYKGSVCSVALNQDGSVGLTCSVNNAILWDITNESKNIPLKGHNEKVSSVAVSNDGSIALTGAEDGIVILWDIVHRNHPVKLSTLREHFYPISSMAISSDNKMALTGSIDRRAILWNISNKRGPSIFSILEDHKQGVYSVAISYDGSLALTSSAYKVTLWDISNKYHPVPFSVLNIPVLGERENCVYSLALSKDSTILLAGLADNTAILWNISNRKSPVQLSILNGHTSDVNAVALNSDASVALTGSSDNKVIMWDISKSRPIILAETTRHTGSVLSVAMSADAKTALTGSHDKTATLWNIDEALFSKKVENLKEKLQDNKNVYLNCKSFDLINSSFEQARRFQEASGSKLQLINYFISKYKAYLSHFTKNKICSASICSTLDGHKKSVSSVAMSRDGSIALTGSSDGAAILWNISNRSEPSIFSILKQHIDSVTSVAISEDGNIALTASNLYSILWNISNRSDPIMLSKLVNDYYCSGTRSVAIAQDSSTCLTSLSLRDISNLPKVSSSVTLDSDEAYSNSRSIAVALSRLYDFSKIRSALDGCGIIKELTNHIMEYLPKEEAIALHTKFDTDKEELIVCVMDVSNRAKPSLLSTLNCGRSNMFSPIGLAVSRDTSKVLVGLEDKATLWDISDIRKPFMDSEFLSKTSSGKAKKYYISSVAINDDSSIALVSLNKKKTDHFRLELWNITKKSSSSLLTTLSGHKYSINSVALNSDASMALTGSSDSTAILWEISSENVSMFSKMDISQIQLLVKLASLKEYNDQLSQPDYNKIFKSLNSRIQENILKWIQSLPEVKKSNG